ncbi:MAG: hypothetical protein NZL87_04110 [Thermomicrobium sp.]|nr:hypothetical protein [Thermomicrobium sp.]MDW7981371.1 hypothetical protein [Thermomicrobium sp.]
MTDHVWAWLTLAGLGFFHGLNPAMGWLFAVALGLQEQRLGAVLRALIPIGLGHAAAVGCAALATLLLGTVVPAPLVLILAGSVLLGFTAWRLWRRFRHPRTRFRATPRELALWSFLMASAHGAGLMVVPLVAVLLGQESRPATHGEAAHLAHFGQSASVAFAAVVVHTVAMFLAMTLVAVIVYRELGVELLRRAWINVDLLWVGVLVVTGLSSLALGLRALL